MAEAQRKRRLEAEIQRVLAEVIQRDLKDPRVGNVTVTAVSVAADMGSARVYFTPFASRHTPEEVRTGLTRAGGFLRGEVGRRLQLRHAPRLEFVYDDTVDRAAHLSGLIENAVRDDRARHEDDSPAADGGSPADGG
ncbi:MAG: 30S ribosome-binding factor RbfA [Sinobacteraceae bacterium]|nr:30S ribosome-binding factor RbfA [Nevskiaceae bacterium]MBV9912792.1 30S ribosome-binding factor RbfA [Nevskiaceae bacterium]